MLSNSVLRTQKTENVGGRIMIEQEKATHNLKLHQIYSSPRLLSKKTPPPPPRNQHPKKKDIFTQVEHQRNIQHLYSFICRPKNMSDRLKDPNDFFAYPTYFRREQEPASRKGRRKLTRTHS